MLSLESTSGQGSLENSLRNIPASPSLATLLFDAAREAASCFPNDMIANASDKREMFVEERRKSEQLIDQTWLIYTSEQILCMKRRINESSS